MVTSSSFDPLRNLQQMASLISQVSGEPVPVVIERLQQEQSHPGRSVAKDFARQDGPRYVWGPHLDAFYGATNAFLYELAIWNRNSLKAGLRKWTARHMARQNRPLDLLSIGDGLGFDCLHFARKGHRVTYFELPGLSERFARLLFDGSNSKIPMLTDPTAIPKESFDAITCFDVLEHVPDPVEMVKTLITYLRPGGVLYVSAPFFLILPWYPTHLRSNRKFSGSLRLYTQAGLRLVGGNASWQPVVLQKPGGEPLGANGLQILGIRLFGAYLSVGRLMAWPFVPAHWVRKVFGRKF